MDKYERRYRGYTIDWAHGRLKWADEALDHIDQFGLIPGDRRPYTLATDLPAIKFVLGALADGHPTIIRIKAALTAWHIDHDDICDQLFGE